MHNEHIVVSYNGTKYEFPTLVDVHKWLVVGKAQGNFPAHVDLYEAPDGEWEVK
jgi:hypothetical protein